MKKAFTLIEILIVICILGIFSVVLFRTYKTISEISFRVEQQKNVNEEFLFLSEVLQNFANRNSIDFDKYWIDLINSKWFTWVLYLSWEDGQFSIYTSWNCASYWTEPLVEELSEWCSFFFQKTGGESIKITNDSVYFSQANFKIIPYLDNYFSSEEDAAPCDTNYFVCVNDDWFWLFTDIYPKSYNTGVWSNDIHVLVQHFFNI